MADEAIPNTTLYNLFDDNWDEGNIVKPQLIEVNTPTTSQLRVDLTKGDAVLLISDPTGRQERWRGNWSWKDISDLVIVDVITKESRQRLYNIIAEIRRIIESNMHSLTDYQVVRFIGFSEKTEQELNFWRATVKVSLESVAVATNRTCA